MLAACWPAVKMSMLIFAIAGLCLFICMLDILTGVIISAAIAFLGLAVLAFPFYPRLFPKKFKKGIIEADETTILTLEETGFLIQLQQKNEPPSEPEIFEYKNYKNLWCKEKYGKFYFRESKKYITIFDASEIVQGDVAQLRNLFKEKGIEIR